MQVLQNRKSILITRRTLALLLLLTTIIPICSTSSSFLATSPSQDSFLYTHCNTSVSAEASAYSSLSFTNRPLTPTPESPEWVVTGDEVRRNDRIVLNGDLIIKAGGNLTLINVTLLINCSYDGEYGIVVKTGGCLNVLNQSVITAYNPSYRYYLRVEVAAAFHMFDSELHYCGYGEYDEKWSGFVVEALDVVIVNSRISHNLVGVYCYLGAVTISNCTIENNDEVGIRCYSALHAYVTNCLIRRNKRGISCTLFTDDAKFTNCTICDNEKEGAFFDLIDSRNVTVCECNIYNNSYGIFCYSTKNIVICNCTIHDNLYAGILCGEFCHHLHIYNNQFVHDGILLDGLFLDDYIHYIYNNTVNGKPLCYLLNVSNKTITSNVGQLVVVNSYDISINEQVIEDTNIAVELFFTEYVTIERSSFNKNRYGILCRHADEVYIRCCTLDSNTQCGIRSVDSGVTLDSSMISNNYRGLCLGLSYTEAKNCTLINNTYGAWCEETSYVLLFNCTITRNSYGIWCAGDSSSAINVTYCCIYGNLNHGIFNDSPSYIFAVNNWWGSPDGPEYTENGDPEDPEEIYSTRDPSLITYEPWLREPYGATSLFTPFDVLTQHLHTIMTIALITLIVLFGVLAIIAIVWEREKRGMVSPL